MQAEDLKGEKASLKRLLVKGIHLVFQRLKEIVPTDSDLSDQLLILESNYKDYQGRFLKGIITYESFLLQDNILKDKLLAIINKLDEASLKKRVPKIKIKANRGKVLYNIPSKMKVGVESKCRVRLAYNETLLLDNIELNKEDTIRDIRVSNVMQVNIFDGEGNSSNFAIRSYNSEEQILNKDEATEWTFYIKPHNAGEHKLVLKITLIEEVEGKERKKDVVLEEEIVTVVSSGENIQISDEENFKEAAGTFLLSSIDGQIGRRNNILVSQLVGQLLGVDVKKVIVLTSVLLLLITGGPYAFNWVQHELFWRDVVAKNQQSEYEEYQKRYPEGKYLEDASWGVARVKNTVESYQEYLNDFSNGRFVEDAFWNISKLKNSIQGYNDFMTQFPNSKWFSNAKAAKEKLIKEGAPKLNLQIKSDSLFINIEKGFLPFYFELTHENRSKFFSNSLHTRDTVIDIKMLLASPGVKNAKLIDYYKNESIISFKDSQIDDLSQLATNTSSDSLIVFNKKTINLDQLLIGEVAQFQVEVKNISSHKVQIDKFSFSKPNGWRVLPNKKIILSPNESKEITVVFKSKSARIVNNSIDVLLTSVTRRLNSQTVSESKLSLKAYITSKINDSRDGNTYQVIPLAGKIWLAENLRYDIDFHNDRETHLSCKFDGKDKLYKWGDAQAEGSACPEGWKLPDSEDWQSVFRAFGDDFIVNEGDTSQTAYNELILNGRSNFNLTPNDVYWTSTKIEQKSIEAVQLTEGSTKIMTIQKQSYECLKCRCVKKSSRRKIRID